jgi:hypothetical protein
MREHSRKILVISYYSPPYRSSYGTQRLIKFIKFLLMRGWNITLLTSELPRNEPIAEEEEKLPKKLRVVRIPPTRLFSNLKWRGKFVPDDFIGWIRPAVDRAMEIIAEDRPSIIFSTAPPYSNMIIGTICSSKSKSIPHITDFRDPWTRIDVIWVIKGKIRKWINKKLEGEVLKRSKYVIMADDLAYKDDFFIKGVRKIKAPIISISNGYDEDDFKNILPHRKSRNKMFSISYVGGFYDQETFNNFLDPLLFWAKLFPEDMSQVMLLYAGASSHFFNNCYELPFFLENHGYLSHREAILLRYRSDIQMFSQPSYFKPHIFSGKIFEMIRTPVPILAITRTDGAVARLLDKTKTGFSVSQGKDEKAALILKKIFEDWKTNKIKYNPQLSVILGYSRESLANKLAEVLDLCVDSVHACK